MKPDAPYKLMLLSDPAPFITGYATVTKNILTRLNKYPDWEVTALGSLPIGEPMKKIEFEDGSVFDFRVLGAQREQYSLDVVPKYIQKYGINLFGILLDTFMVHPKLLQIDIPAKSFFYFPSDGGGHLPLGCEQILKKVNLPIAMSKFGQKQVKDVHGIDSVYIPHGVNIDLYKPTENKAQVKAEAPCVMFNGQQLVHTPGVFSNKFVVGSVFRNQPRKFPDRLYKAFAKFAKGKDNVILYLHTDPQDVSSPVNTFELLKRLNILHKVVFTGTNYATGFSTQEVAKIYNAMDVFFLLTSGEGFGIPTLEAMSSGVPVVITDGTTTPELVMENGQCGEPVRLVGTELITVHELLLERGYTSQQIDEHLAPGTLIGSYNVDRNIADINHAVECLEKLYKDPELRAQYGNVGREKAVKYYDWEKLIPVWDKVLRGLVDS